MKITTASGFTAEIDDSFRDDWEYIEALDAIMDRTPGAVVKLADVVLGEAKAALKEHCRRENGRVSRTEMEKELLEIINAAGKNS